MASATSTKRAAFATLQFLNAALDDGSVKADDKESVGVAIQCIAEAFGVDLDADQDKRAYGVTKSLPAILDDVASQEPAEPAVKETSAEDKQAAEAAKSRGNQLMAKKDYPGAIAAYGEAIEKDGSNAVYWSNRAAAYSQIQEHQSAVSDAREAIKIDPTFSKAYSRLGHALFSSGEYEDAVEAYEKGLELDPTNAVMKSSLATARSRLPASTAQGSTDSSSVSRGNTPAGGAGAGAGGMPGFPGMGGGMPGLAEMMNNPAIMNMAQQMMQNGGMERIMQNPMMQQMMNSMGGGGGGMPDIGALMNDPEMRRMAEQFGGAMGGGAGRGSGSGSGGNSNMYS
ncbi:hypothetical protein JCM10207_003570 [Rhodosporidiobolus poonsookiae]